MHIDYFSIFNFLLCLLIGLTHFSPESCCAFFDGIDSKMLNHFVDNENYALFCIIFSTGLLLVRKMLILCPESLLNSHNTSNIGLFLLDF